MNEVLPPNTKLVFLVGAPRSGTSWLQLLLSASPSIATATETYLFATYTQSLFFFGMEDASRQTRRRRPASYHECG
jgi:hypothetical protein